MGLLFLRFRSTFSMIWFLKIFAIPLTWNYNVIIFPFSFSQASIFSFSLSTIHRIGYFIVLRVFYISCSWLVFDLSSLIEWSNSSLLSSGLNIFSYTCPTLCKFIQALICALIQFARLSHHGIAVNIWGCIGWNKD